MIQTIKKQIRGVAQVVERYFREVEAASSSLVTPMKKSRFCFTRFCSFYVHGHPDEIYQQS